MTMRRRRRVEGRRSRRRGQGGKCYSRLPSPPGPHSRRPEPGGVRSAEVCGAAPRNPAGRPAYGPAVANEQTPLALARLATVYLPSNPTGSSAYSSSCRGPPRVGEPLIKSAHMSNPSPRPPPPAPPPAKPSPASPSSVGATSTACISNSAEVPRRLTGIRLQWSSRTQAKNDTSQMAATGSASMQAGEYWAGPGRVHESCRPSAALVR